MKSKMLWTGDAVGVNQWKAPFLPKGGKRPQMFLTAKYKDYKSSLVKQMKEDLSNFVGYVDIDVIIFLKREKDTDGPIKGLLDAMTEAGIVEDDKYIRNINIYRHYHNSKRKPKTDDVISLEITTLSEEETLLVLDEIKNVYTHLEAVRNEDELG